MPRRSILSATERESLLALPDAKDELIRQYTFNETDLSVARIVALREGGKSIAETARLAGCSQSQVKRVCALARLAVGDKKERPRS